MSTAAKRLTADIALLFVGAGFLLATLLMVCVNAALLVWSGFVAVAHAIDQAIFRRRA